MKRVSQTCRARFLAFMTNGMNTWNEASDAGHPGRLVGTVGHEVATVHTDLGERVGWSVRAPIDTTFTRDMSAPRLWVVNPCDEEGEGSEGVEIVLMGFEDLMLLAVVEGRAAWRSAARCLASRGGGRHADWSG